jgi:hypothetical protein
MTNLNYVFLLVHGSDAPIISAARYRASVRLTMAGGLALAIGDLEIAAARWGCAGREYCRPRHPSRHRARRRRIRRGAESNGNFAHQRQQVRGITALTPGTRHAASMRCWRHAHRAPSGGGMDGRDHGVTASKPTHQVGNVRKLRAKSAPSVSSTMESTTCSVTKPLRRFSESRR